MDHAHHDPAPAPAWTWAVDANVFAGYNYQLRRYTDFAAWESQNWLMAAAERRRGQASLVVHGMASLEPLTIGRYVFLVGGSRFRAGGSPQLFQTGESFERLPLIDYQHPHDLVMNAGATYRLRRSTVTYTFGADLVGTPTLGPVPFMHRESGRNNPQVPLSHHNLDSTHSTAGVIRAGVGVSGWAFEASAFRGEEPDEDRYDIDQPRLDSWAARVGWTHGPWAAQFSGGRLHEPEWFAPYDQNRLTASIAFNGSIGSRPLAATVAWGQTWEYTPTRAVSDALLAEWDVRVTNSLTTYGRGELVTKELFRHIHTPNAPHPHFFSDIGAATLGVVYDLPFEEIEWSGRLGVGADVTLYRMSPALVDAYGGSKSFHVFLRWRPRTAPAVHVH